MVVCGVCDAMTFFPAGCLSSSPASTEPTDTHTNTEWKNSSHICTESNAMAKGVEEVEEAWRKERGNGARRKTSRKKERGDTGSGA